MTAITKSARESIGAALWRARALSISMATMTSAMGVCRASQWTHPIIRYGQLGLTPSRKIFVLHEEAATCMRADG